MAGCCENAIVEPVIKFVVENLAHAEWNYRDAAIMALGIYKLHYWGLNQLTEYCVSCISGSVLEGPDPSILKEPILKVGGYVVDNVEMLKLHSLSLSLLPFLPLSLSLLHSPLPSSGYW